MLNKFSGVKKYVYLFILNLNYILIVNLHVFVLYKKAR